MFLTQIESVLHISPEKYELHPGGRHFCMNSVLSDQEWRHKKNHSMPLVTEISKSVIGINSVVIAAISTGPDLNLLIADTGMPEYLSSH